MPATTRSEPLDTDQSAAGLEARLAAALERQAATAEILGAIANSHGDASQSLRRIAEITGRLFDAASVSVMIADGARWGLTIRVGAGSERINAAIPVAHATISVQFMPGAVYLENRQVHVPDIDDPEAIARWPGITPARAAGTRTLCGTPLRREGRAIGALIVHRDRLAPFAPDELDLLQSFADQAAIAVENARLVDEVEAKARELTDSLQFQTATSDVLQVISKSPGALEPVFRAVLENATRICNAGFGTLLRFDGSAFHFAADVGTPAALADYVRRPGPFQGLPGGMIDRILKTRSVQHTPDYAADPAPGVAARLGGARSTVGVPILRDDILIGAIVIYRQEVRPFTDREIELVQSFAAQAAIAIENARLFNETREALERQNATAEILRTIASTPGDAQRSLQHIAETSVRLFGTPSISIQLVRNGEWSDAYRLGDIAKSIRVAVPLNTVQVGGKNLPGAVVSENRQIHIPDLDNLDPSLVDFPGLPVARQGGARTICGTPLRREGEAIGSLIVYRDRLVPFTDDELDLMQTFADQAAIAVENARLINETRDALERQTATADILKVIASSPSDVQPVFDAITRIAVRLLRCDRALIQRCDGRVFWTVAWCGPDGPLPINFSAPVAIDPAANFPSRAIVDKRTLHLPDWSAIDLPEFERGVRDRLGINSALYLPLLSEGECLGLLAMAGKGTHIFGEREVALAESFRDQALIAIRNAKLFKETQEALERQTATADILKVIASSPSDVQPVFEAIAERSQRLVEALSTTVFRLVDGVMHLKAFTTTTPQADAVLQSLFPAPLADYSWGEPIRRGEIHRVVDTENEVPSMQELARLRGFRSMLFVPLLRDGEPIGVIAVTRVEPGPFPDHYVELLRTFADQAVIAIQNVQLFDEVQARTRDLGESLEHQTATSEVLKVISRSPGELDPVFQTILASATGICTAEFGNLFVLQEDGGLRCASTINLPPRFAETFSRQSVIYPPPIDPLGRVIATRQHVQVVDAERDPAYATGFRPFVELVELGGAKTILLVPMLKEDVLVGVIAIFRQTLHPFSDKQIDLVTSFANQAVIAIQNTRLFNETREALEQQTAIAEVLGVINASPGNLQPVFEAMVERARRLCDADSGHLVLPSGGDFRTAVVSAMSPELEGLIRSRSYAPGRGTAVGRSLLERRAVQIADIAADSEHAARHAAHGLIRTILGAPLLREGEPIGAFGLSRARVEPFTQRQIELVETFANQAVIAIENARLLSELRERTDDLSESLQQQTATADALKVISRSAFDLQAVLETLTSSAVELSGARRGSIFLRDGDDFRFRAASHAEAHGEWIAFLGQNPQKAGTDSAIARAISSGQTVCIPDVLADPGIRMPATALADIRAVLAVPLLRDGSVEGIFALSRPTPGPFSPRQIELVQTFADQAVIAIENARLFDEVQARTRELSQSLEELRTAQDRLVQTEKLASLGQLTAGIAHEIKNPLNFVNNFSALSVELIDELLEVLQSAPLDAAARGDVDQLTHMLKGNLDKVVQHGRRADSIVKNMLLHSREGSGERRPADINALVEESLNLAYHGARAEKSGFNVTLRRDLAPDAGAIELFPQEITRVLLNLITNGFYATARRKAEAGDGFEPELSAATRDLGHSIEIRIRDNGTGIPPEVREKIFNPFFTTKPAGEGTGLGLSMSHDIIVKQHGGTIAVDTAPGQFTEFIVTLPRAGAPQPKLEN